MIICHHFSFVFGRLWARISTERPTILTEVFHRLPQSPHENAEILSEKDHSGFSHDVSNLSIESSHN
jgi:hypothetical protein